MLAALALGLLASSAACSAGGFPGADQASSISVVTTTPVLSDFARVIGADHVAVYGVLKPNVDPHDFEPSPADLDALANADVIVRNGVGLEHWFDDTIAAADPKGDVVDASTGVALRGDAPHIWHDPRNAELMAANVEAALAKADPVHVADYERNLAAYRRQLEALDAGNAAQI